MSPTTDTEPTPEPAPGPTARPAPWHRLTAVGPVLLMVAVLVLALAAVSPQVRHQVALSVSRVPSPYVELFFADVPTARECPRADGVMTVAVSVRSHLSEPQDLAWTATSTPRRGAPQVSRGVLSTTPGVVTTADVSVPMKPPSTVVIALDGRTEQLVLHCVRTPR